MTRHSSQCLTAGSLFFSHHIFFVFLSFLGPYMGIWRFPGCSCQLELWPLTYARATATGIWAESATYTTAHGNAGSLTHWARPGIEPKTSWFLVEFVNHWATTGTPSMNFKLKYLPYSLVSIYTINATCYFLNIYYQFWLMLFPTIFHKVRLWINTWLQFDSTTTTQNVHMIPKEFSSDVTVGWYFCSIN